MAPTPSNPAPRPIRWPGVLAAGAIGLALGIGAFTFDYAEGTSYLSDDPKACVNCHVMQEMYDAWAHASHHATATCNDCHVPHDSTVHKYLVKGEHGYRHSKGFTLDDFHEPIQIKPSGRAIVADNCRRCHSAIASDLGPDTDCLHCHTRAGHGPLR